MRGEILFAGAVLLALGCASESTGPCESERPARNGERVSISEGIWGDLWFWSGDFMPICESGEVRAVSRKVRIHELTSRDQVEQSSGAFYMSIKTPLVASVTSDARGFFEVAVPPGAYSVFIVEGDQFYANVSDGQGHISPVHVNAGSVSGVRIDINYAATY